MEPRTEKSYPTLQFLKNTVQILMNNIPKTAPANNSTNTPRTAGANKEGGRPTAAAAAEIGVQAVRQGVRFSPNNNEQIQEQIRTYVPKEAMTPERTAEGDRLGTLAVVLKELTRTKNPIAPAFETTAPGPSRWVSNSTPVLPQRSADAAPAQPRRSSDAVPSLPKRTSD